MQEANRSQAGRIPPRASLQASQADSALPLSIISQAGNPQALQAGTFLASLGEITLSQVESEISQAGSSQTSPGDRTLSPAESEISQTGSSQASLVDSTPPQEESVVLPQAVRCSGRLRASQD